MDKAISPTARRLWRVGFLALALMLALVVACGASSSDAGNIETDPQSSQVRGRVLEVVGRNIVELETLRIRDESGKEWTFGAAEGFIGLSPSHLREHKLLGESVLVTYVIQGNELIAVDITD